MANDNNDPIIRKDNQTSTEEKPGRQDSASTLPYDADFEFYCEHEHDVFRSYN